MSTVAIIDDHRVFSDRLAAFVEGLPGWSVAGTAEDADSGLELLRTTEPDVALVDVGLRGRNGFWLTERALRSVPSLRVILMSESEPEEYAEAAAEAGAIAFLAKSAVSRELPGLLGRDPRSDAPAGNWASGAGSTTQTTGSHPAGSVAATLMERSILSKVNYFLIAGAAFLGFATAGQPVLGAAAALALLILHRQGSPSRVRRGRVGGRGLRRSDRDR